MNYFSLKVISLNSSVKDEFNDVKTNSKIKKKSKNLKKLKKGRGGRGIGVICECNL